MPQPTKFGISRDNAYLMMAVAFMLTPNNLKVFARRGEGRVPVNHDNDLNFDGNDPIDFEGADSTLHFFFPKDYAWAVNDSVTGFANQPVVQRYFSSDSISAAFSLTGSRVNNYHFLSAHK